MSSFLRLRSSLAVALAASVALTPSVAGAADDETTRARSLFQEGISLEAAGNYAAALAKFQEVAQFKHTPQVVFHVGFCQEHVGRLVEALGSYKLASSEADGPKLETVRRTANDASAALEKRVPLLTLKLAQGAEAAVVSVDGVALGAGSLGAPMRVNPGAHTVEATLAEHDAFRAVVTLAEAEAKTVEVKLRESTKPALTPPVAPVAPVASSAASGSSPSSLPPSSTSAPEAHGSGAWPYVLTGVGVASFGAAIGMFVVRRNAVDDLNGTCLRGVCPTSSQSTDDRGKRVTTLGDVFLGVGAVGVGLGAFLFIKDAASSSSASSSAAALASPRYDLGLAPTSGGATAALRGRF